MIVGDRAPAHQRRNDRDAGDFGKFGEQIGRIGIDDTTTGDDQRTVRRVQHGDRLFGLRPRRGRLIGLQRRVGIDIEFDFGQLHIDRQVDQHRTGTARPHQVKRLLETRTEPAPAPSR